MNALYHWERGEAWYTGQLSGIKVKLKEREAFPYLLRTVVKRMRLTRFGKPTCSSAPRTPSTQLTSHALGSAGSPNPA